MTTIERGLVSMTHMKHGVFLNQKNSLCSIYETGRIIKDILKGHSDDYSIDYFEVDSKLTGFNWYNYDFYIINWHPHTLTIKKELLDRMQGKKIAIIVEVDEHDYNPFTPEWFDAYMTIDPTKERKGSYFPFPRPIQQSPTLPLLSDSKLVLGSFGLFSHKFQDEKRFGEVVEAANNCGGEAIVRINLPMASFTYTSMAEINAYGDKLRGMAKPNVDLRITKSYFDRDDLVAWLSEHTMNCFPYYRNRPGLAAVTDQAIAAGRAIMTTECNTFRHIHQYINHYPKQSYIDLSLTTPTGVRAMQADWSPDNFRKEFHNMLTEMKIL